ncbi:MAG TPA: hypothetical protein VFJ93_07720 [Gaiellaceae bacterium]|nr:hypothetical protein [Gaiellaceae bacterium]
MPFITINKGGPSTEIPDGVYSVTLIDIKGPRTVTAQKGPRAGEDVDLLDWEFAIEEGQGADNATIDASTSTASGPRSKLFAFLTALFGGIAPPIGTQLEKEQLVGRQALATIQADDGGWPRIVNLGAMPRQQARPAAVPTDNTAVVAKPRRNAPAVEATIQDANGTRPAFPVAQAPVAAADDLPF